MDPIEEWTAGQARVTALMAAASPAQVEQRVPATPGWTGRELLAHMIGLDADVLAGAEADDHNDVWTQAHVDARRTSDVPTLLAEWAAMREPLRTWMRENNPRPMGDVLIHEQDLRGLLGQPGARDTAGLAGVRDTMLGRFGKAVADLPPIALVGEAWGWCSAGETDDAACVLAAPDFDLARALMTRRSAAQLRSWVQRGDVTPYLDAFAVVGPLPEVDLSD